MVFPSIHVIQGRIKRQDAPRSRDAAPFGEPRATPGVRFEHRDGTTLAEMD